MSIFKVILISAIVLVTLRSPCVIFKRWCVIQEFHLGYSLFVQEDGLLAPWNRILYRFFFSNVSFCISPLMDPSMIADSCCCAYPVFFHDHFDHQSVKHTMYEGTYGDVAVCLCIIDEQCKTLLIVVE
ncbi:hypothetical protein BDV25DRAFT_51280 [Aspergillus avenaceus]|uniref:Uncharacterized protein n=1 Tax=Aspergillus avenaceus TaxID=36643 RepID=A0A5N6TJG0_ASPAV|nr:hypothetical protein BDV25DRAFT_51280 [Aspergillus avenaceus]